jgi:hypothetical protein
MRMAIVAVALLMAGCTASLHPLYSEVDALFDPMLLGAWRESEGEKFGEKFFVSVRAGNAAYRVIYYDGEGSGAFTARLVELQGNRFVDLYPETPPSKNGFDNCLLIPAHSFGRIWLAGDRLTIALLDPDWLGSEQASRVLLERISLDDYLVISAATADLRRFAAKYADTKAFSVTSEWVREQ